MILGGVMKKISFAFILSLLFAGCTGRDPDLLNVDLFQYKDTYLGDNSAVGNLLNQLEDSEELKQFSLNTGEKPYGITLDYLHLESNNAHEMVITNSTFLFALIQNLDEVTFQFKDREIIVTQEVLENGYGKSLNEFETEQELRTSIQEQIESYDLIKQIFQ